MQNQIVNPPYQGMQGRYYKNPPQDLLKTHFEEVKAKDEEKRLRELEQLITQLHIDTKEEQKELDPNYSEADNSE